MENFKQGSKRGKGNVNKWKVNFIKRDYENPINFMTGGRNLKKEYVIYKGDKVVFIGTKEECAKHFEVTEKTIQKWALPCRAKKAEEQGSKGLTIAVKTW